jgi:hypothetical protein
MLVKYGSICLLDATYDTSDYILPLFFLVVPTNVRYVIVASFITNKEDTAAITEALHMIRDNNAAWQQILMSGKSVPLKELFLVNIYLNTILSLEH